MRSRSAASPHGSPTALCKLSSERNELEQTSSASVPVLCAAVVRAGRISWRIAESRPAPAARRPRCRQARHRSRGPVGTSCHLRFTILYLTARNSFTLQRLYLRTRTGSEPPMTLVRRDLLSGIMGFCVAAAAARSSGHGEEAPAIRFGEPQPFSPDLVRERARALAGQAFEPADGTLPEVLTELDYDKHRAIYSAPKWLWHGLGLDAEVQLSTSDTTSRRQCISMKWLTGWRARCSTPPAVRLRPERFQARLCRGPWLRRLPAARTAQSPRLSRRACGISRGELFPRARPQSAVWYFVAGRGDRHRSAEAGGVSGVSPLLLERPAPGADRSRCTLCWTGRA